MLKNRKLIAGFLCTMMSFSFINGNSAAYSAEENSYSTETENYTNEELGSIEMNSDYINQVQRHESIEENSLNESVDKNTEIPNDDLSDIYYDEYHDQSLENESIEANNYVDDSNNLEPESNLDEDEESEFTDEVQSFDASGEVIWGEGSNYTWTNSKCTIDKIVFTINSDNSTCYISDADINISGDIILPDKIKVNGKYYSITSIGDFAFKCCINLNSIIIPQCVTSIGERTFEYCTSLSNITITKNIVSIDTNAITNCYKLKNIYVDSNNSKFTSIDGVLYSKDKTTILAYPPAKEDKIYNIPEGVTTLGVSSFEECNNLESVTIPNTVVTLEDDVFWACKALKDITIPDSVTTMGDRIFKYCTNLSSITLSNNITNIGSSEFYYCTSLSHITLPDKIKTIDNYAFYNCVNLGNIAIPKDLTNIGYNAFYNCKSLQGIYVDSNNNNYSDMDGILLNKDKTKLLIYPAAKSETNYIIPSSVTSIGPYAFYYSSNLNSITISENITSIENTSFLYCTNLQNIFVNSNNKNYSDTDGILLNKNKTELIKYPEGKSETGYSISNIIKTIDAYAFHNSVNLSNIIIPDSVTNIGNQAFEYCTNLSSITIPKSVVSIGNNAITNCYKLKDIYVDNDNSKFTSIDGVLYSKDKTKLLYYPCAKEGVIYNIPDGVAIIGANSFEECDNLKSIVIPQSVTKIENDAFWYSKNLFDISIPSSVTSVETRAFYYCLSLNSISIPSSVTSIGNNTFYHCINLASVWTSSSQYNKFKDILTQNSDAVLIESNLYNREHYKNDPIKIKADSVKCFEILPDGSKAEITLRKDSDGNYIHDPSRYKAGIRNYSYEAVKDGVSYESPVISVQVNDDDVISSWNDNLYTENGITYFRTSDNTVKVKSYSDDISSNLIIPGLITVDEETYSVEGIEDEAFKNCTSLQNVQIDNGVSNIGQRAFDGDLSLKSVSISSSVTAIADNCFDNCGALNNIEINSGNPNYSSEYGILYNKDKTALIKYPQGKENAEYNLPDSINDISDNALISCSNLKVIWMSLEQYRLLQNNISNVTAAANNLYENKQYKKDTQAEPLKVKGNNVKWFTKNENGEVSLVDESRISNEDGYSICIPDTDVRGELEYYAQLIIDNKIYTSHSIKIETYGDIEIEITPSLPDTEENTGDNTDSDNNKVNAGGIGITIPSGTSSGSSSEETTENTDDSGSGSTGDSGKNTGSVSDVDKDIDGDVTVPGYIKVDGQYIAITEITAKAFAECENMQKLEIPSTVENIDSSAFMGCKSLKEIKVSPDNPYYCSVDGVLYNKDKTEIIVYPAGKTDESYTILDSVTGIGENAFYGAASLKTIDMSDNVLEIGKNAFTSCTGLENIRLSEGITKMNQVMFNGCSSLQNIVIPSNVTSIGAKVFTSCKNLITAKVPSGASVNKKAFYRCNSNFQIIEY